MSDSATFTEGMQAYRQGEYARASRALGAIAVRDDLMGRLARYYCALSHRAVGIEDLQAGRLDSAVWRLRQAVNLVGHKADLAEYLMVAYATAGRHERCAAEAGVLAEHNRQDVSAHVRLAQTQWRSGQQLAAIMTLTGALRQLGDHFELHLHLGVIYAADDEHKLAREHLEKAIECDAASARAHRYLGLVHAAQGQFVPACGALARALSLAPEDLLAAFWLCQSADAARRTGQQVTIAIPDSARLVPQSILQGSTGVSPVVAGPPDTGGTPVLPQIRQLAEYVAAEPDFVGAFLALPESRADEELFGVLVAVLRTALSGHPGYADLHYYASLALTRLKDFESARAHAVKAVGINPRYAKALVQLGRLASRCGQKRQAADFVRQAVDSGANWPDVHVLLGDLLRDCGDRVDSARHYRRALELNAHYGPARSHLAALAA